MKPSEIVFLFLHEMQHQVLHTVPILDEMARRGDRYKVRAFVCGADNLAFIKTLLTPQALANIDFIERDSPALFKAAEWLLGHAMPLSRFGFLLAMRKTFKTADIVVSPETTCLALKRWRALAHIRFVFVPHGAGDRAVSFEKKIQCFDHVFVAGEKTLSRMLEEKVVQPGQVTQIGYPKFLAINQTALTRQQLFGNDNPVFLYNPHFDPYLSSWYDMGEAVLDLFLQRSRLNLVCAPHVMMYCRAVQISTPQRLIKRVPKIPAKYNDAPNIVIDTGSARCVDMTYTRMADVYIGDASSQVYEFIHQPRRVVYLNPRGHNWADDPYFAHWHFGSVFSGADDLGAFLDAGDVIANPHRSLQERAAAHTFNGAIENAAVAAADALEAIAAAAPVRPAR